MRRCVEALLLAMLVIPSGCAPDASESMPFDAVADGRQLMVSVIEPAAEVYWDAVGVIMDLEGTHEIEPRSDEEWEAVENAAWVLAESGNLLLMEDRAQGREHWIAMSRAMIEVGRRAVDAAVTKDPGGGLRHGGRGVLRLRGVPRGLRYGDDPPERHAGFG